jgi:hypothetical protein
MSMTVEHAARPFFGRAYMSLPLRQSRGLDWIDLALIAVFFAGIYTNYPIAVSKTVLSPPRLPGWRVSCCCGAGARTFPGPA